MFGKRLCRSLYLADGLLLIGVTAKLSFFDPQPAEAVLSSATLDIQKVHQSMTNLPVQKFQDMTFVFAGDWANASLASVMRHNLSLRSLERLCRMQAALPSDERTRRELEQMAVEYMKRADRLDRQSDQPAQPTQK